MQTTEAPIEVTTATPTLSERQKAQAGHRSRKSLEAGPRRLIVPYKRSLERFAMGDTSAFPVIVINPGTGYQEVFRSVEILGSSRLVPFADKLNICGREEGNHLAIETDAEIIGCD